MKRKQRETAEAISPKNGEVLDRPSAALRSGKSKLPAKKCSVCTNDASATPAFAGADEEVLCWVCRRLKISAWRDTDPQMAVQE